MRRRQPDAGLPKKWLFADERLGEELWSTLERLPRGAGVVVRYHGHPRRKDLLQQIRRIARKRGLILFDEAAGDVARVHGVAELRRALTRRVPLIFISALYPTRSHPDRLPLPRMRAATLARLASAPVFALGGMNARRFRAVKPLGFAGWGAIDAWLGGRPRT